MGLFRYSFKYQRKYLAICLLYALIAGLLSAYISKDNGFLIQLIVCVFVVALLMSVAFLTINNKAYKAYKVLDEKGICDELVQVYKSCNKRMKAINHIVLASYYTILGNTDETQRELDLAAQGNISSAFVKMYYLDVLIGLKIRQNRFDEAAKIYSDNRQAIESYGDSHKDDMSVSLYGLGAVLCAKQGNFDQATALLDRTEPAIQLKKERMFNKNISLMTVYLIKGELETADQVKQDMLNDLQTFSEFELKSSKMTWTNRVKDAQMRFDPRAQIM